jgi:redox-sensitive bicupin YhaK (pirin superfamily)
MKLNLIKSNTRGHVDHGWLNAHHSFSFASYYDPERVHFGVLRVLNDDIVKGGEGFGMHPHDNMEIITIVLKGALEHKDSMGNVGVIHANEVQVMSAGTGVHHSEYNHLSDEEVNLLQIWVFPDTKNVKPRYDQKRFEADERLNRFQQIVKGDKALNEEGLWVHQDVRFFRTRLELGKELSFEPRTGKYGIYLFVIEGKVDVNEKEIGVRDALTITEPGKFVIKAMDEAELLLMEVPI